MRILVIDRFEGAYAICEDKDQKFFAIETGELPAGSWSKDAAAYLHTEQMEGLLQEACQSHALVLVDTPPVCDSPDALLVGRYTSGVLLVVWKNVAKCADIQQTVSRLNDACIPILGSVLVSKTRR